MTTSILTTKLYMPAPRRNLVPRQRLTERLDDGLRRKLTLVSAPAGYGKTTLVSDWIARSNIPAAWLSLDASDNDLFRFFSYLITALQQVNPGIGIDIEPILETDSDPPLEIEPLLTTLVNDIAASATDPSSHPPVLAPRAQAGQGGAAQVQAGQSSGQGFVLVLDDYHVIHEFKIHEALDFLLDHIPPGMHVLINSRADPPMPLGRLRVQRELTEIREAELRFSVDETTAFLNDLMGLALSPEDIENLEARTEGWIAGLQLAALTLQGRVDKHEMIVAFSGSHRHLIDYLIDEVMSRQPEKVREFLQRTSILEQFNASLCDALTLESGSKEMLLGLEQANLFLIPLDSERRWYRYHHLFADFLRERLRATQPEITPQLYVRASQWYEAHGMLDEAVRHAFAGDDVTRAARLLDENAETLILSHSAVDKVLRWANRLPVETRARFPRLCIYHAWALQFEYQLDSVEPTLALAEAHLTDPTRLPESFPPGQITYHAAAIRAYTAQKRGEVDRAIELSLAALKTLPKEDTQEVLVVRGTITLGLGMGYLELGQMEAAHQALKTALLLSQQTRNRYAALSCILYLMETKIACGALSRAYANGEKGLFWIEEWSRSEGRKRRPVRMLAHLRRQMGRVQYERNALEQAAVNLNKATKYYELVGSWSRVGSYVSLIDLHVALGDVEAALGYLRKLKRISLRPGLSLPDIPLAAQIAERNLLLSQAQPGLKHLLAEAAGWVETSGLSPDDEFRYGQEYAYLTLARVLIAQNKTQDAIPLLGHLITSAEDAGRGGQLIAYLSLQAIAHQAGHKTDSALAYLSRALALGEPEGFIRTFVDLGPPMQNLLQTAAWRDIAPGYVSRLLAAFPDVELDFAQAPPALPRQHEIDGLLEPLSEREMQILRLLVARLSYREIAEELYLSLNTIKWHAKNIYGKLGVNKRGDAASRARELGLL